jgi:orotate phosphoribosyltransferase
METAGLVLGILGLFGWPLLYEKFSDTVLLWWYRFTWTAKKVQSETCLAVRRNLIRFPESRNVAIYEASGIHVRYYIDFLSAITRPNERRALERSLVRWLHLHLRAKPHRIAVPKLGNVLLAETVARRLRIPLVIVRQDKDYFVRGDGVDGDILPSERVLIVDDVASDCDFLARCVDVLRQARANVVGIMVLVDRKEGRCASLAEDDLEFSAIVSLGDDELKTLDAGHSASN